jgi:hypothetical protein
MIAKIRGCKPVNIYIKYQNQTKEIKFCLFHNVNVLKDQIHFKLYIKPEYQEIYFDGKLLDKEVDDIYKLGIKENSIIDLKFKHYISIDDIYDYKEMYKSQINQLEEMGFSENEINLNILKQCLGDINYYFENNRKFN